MASEDPVASPPIELSGTNAVVSSAVYREGNAFPIYNLTISNETSAFELFWDGESLGTYDPGDFGTDHAKILKNALESTTIIDYAQVEEFPTEPDYTLTPVNPYHRRFLVLAIPDLGELASLNGSKYANASSASVVEYLTNYEHGDHFTWSALSSGNIVSSLSTMHQPWNLRFLMMVGP